MFLNGLPNVHLLGNGGSPPSTLAAATSTTLPASAAAGASGTSSAHGTATTTTNRVAAAHSGGSATAATGTSGASGPSGATGPSGTTGTSGNTGTTGESGTTGASGNTGTPQVLVPLTQRLGSWTSSPFTITSGTWQLGWAFACERATAGYTFQLLIVKQKAAGSPQPAVRDTALHDQGIAQETATGTLEVEAEENPFCVSAIKVVGVGS
jgi:hypothetical protein